MAKTKAQKKELLKQYKELLDDSKGIVIVKSKGVNPNEVNSFKKELYDFDSEYHVIKNNIFKIALKDSDLAEEESLNFGEHSVLYFKEDVVSPAKSLKKFIEDTKADKTTFKVEFVSGYLDGARLSKEQVTELADMPSKEQSIAMIMGIIDQAMSSVVNVLEDAPRSFVTIIEQAFDESK